jgi:hypothetical protein
VSSSPTRPQYKSAINTYREAGGRFPQGFSTGAVALESKGTLLEGAGGGGGPLAAPVPQVIPGVVEKLFQRSRSPTCSCRGRRREQPPVRRGRHRDLRRRGCG